MATLCPPLNSVRKKIRLKDYSLEYKKNVYFILDTKDNKNRKSIKRHSDFRCCGVCSSSSEVVIVQGHYSDHKTEKIYK